MVANLALAASPGNAGEEWATRVAGRYDVQARDDAPDPEWDDYLTGVTGNHHVQSSLWGQVNRCLGWRAARLIATCGRTITAGAQVLFRPLSDEAAVGYVPNGPVFATDDPALRRALFSELSSLAQRHRIQFLIVQPPANAMGWVHELPELGFKESAAKLGLTATVLLDLSLDLDAILSQMRARTRYNVRLSSRSGIRVREGAADDLDTYYQLLVTTSRRQRFAIHPKCYFADMWRFLAPAGHLKLFLAEYQGEVVSAQLAVAFGDTVVNKLSVWSGAQSAGKPNEALQWHAICWARSHGYRYLDLEGIDPRAAAAVLGGHPLPPDLQQSFSLFKLGFGGTTLLLPGTYDHIYDQPMRAFYDLILAHAGAFSLGA